MENDHTSLPAGVLQVGCMTRIIAGASPVGLGAVLAQLKGNVWRVIANVEKRYSQTEKGVLTLVNVGL